MGKRDWGAEGVINRLKKGDRRGWVKDYLKRQRKTLLKQEERRWKNLDEGSPLKFSVLSIK